MLHIIEKMIEDIMDEIDGAKEYAEKYIENRARGNVARSNKYKEMANDELRHAAYAHEFAMQDIEELKKVMEIPVEDEEKWERAHKKYSECTAWIKRMLD